MTVLYPVFLWLLIPLMLLLWKSSKNIMQGVHLAILMLLVLSLSRPVAEQVLHEASITAKEIVIALDVSYSMRATDIKPTRYDFAKEVIEELLKVNPADNIMLIAFTSNPLLLSPPTTDHRLINVALKSLNPEFILTKGTSLKKLFQKLSTMSLGHRNLILISDGGEENNLPSLKALVEKSNLDLIVLALGSRQGTSIRLEDNSLLKDKEGNLVISRINPLLESLSSSVYGSYTIPSSTAIATARELNSLLLANQNQAQKVKKLQRHYLELYQIPLGLALLLFFILHTRAIKYLYILFAFLGLPAQASFLDQYHLRQAYKSYEVNDFNASQKQVQKIQHLSLQSQMTLANTYYKQQHFKQAIKTYRSISSTSASIKQKLYYNIANAYAMQEVYDKAKIYYTKALQLGSDSDVLHNLNLIALLASKKDADLGIAHPKSQDSSSSKSQNQETKEDEARNEDDPSSGSGGGGESQTQKEQPKEEQEKTLQSTKEEEAHPLSSKVYELINKGYIRETQPW